MRLAATARGCYSETKLGSVAIQKFVRASLKNTPQWQWKGNCVCRSVTATGVPARVWGLPPVTLPPPPSHEYAHAQRRFAQLSAAPSPGASPGNGAQGGSGGGSGDLPMNFVPSNGPTHPLFAARRRPTRTPRLTAHRFVCRGADVVQPVHRLAVGAENAPQYHSNDAWLSRRCKNPYLSRPGR